MCHEKTVSLMKNPYPLYPVPEYKKDSAQKLDAVVCVLDIFLWFENDLLNKGGLFILIDNHFQLHSIQLFSDCQAFYEKSL